jgi:hypothetical protein
MSSIPIGQIRCLIIAIYNKGAHAPNPPSDSTEARKFGGYPNTRKSRKALHGLRSGPSGEIRGGA